MNIHWCIGSERGGREERKVREGFGLTMAARTYGGKERTWDIAIEKPIPERRIMGRK